LRALNIVDALTVSPTIQADRKTSGRGTGRLPGRLARDRSGHDEWSSKCDPAFRPFSENPCIPRVRFFDVLAAFAATLFYKPTTQ
jgi:hypothetical protein